MPCSTIRGCYVFLFSLLFKIWTFDLYDLFSVDVLICEHIILIWAIMFMIFDLIWLLIHWVFGIFWFGFGVLLWISMCEWWKGRQWHEIGVVCATENQKPIEPNWIRSVWFGSVGLQKKNRLVGILYQVIGAVRLIFCPKLNRNWLWTPLTTVVIIIFHLTR